MTVFLLRLGTMSVQATVIIGVVLLLRFFFSKLHIAKKYTNLLWIIPYIAMILPWGIKTPFSFWQFTEAGQTKIEQAVNTMPYSAERFTQTVVDQEVLREMEANRYAPPSLEMAGTENSELTGSTGNDITTGNVENMQGNVRDTDNTDAGIFSNLTTWDRIVYTLFAIWILGMTVFLMYGVISSLKLKKRLVCSLLLTENVYIADDIKEPFVFGVFSPKIYLPCNLTKDNEYYVVEHEKTHIQRKDPIKKVIAFGITGIHWFNPFAWIAFHMMTKDMEMACDEETIQRIGVEKRKDYATSLLKLSTKKRNLLIPVAFGEGNVKSRINNVLRYKKTLKVLAVAAAGIIVVVAAIFLTKPIEKTTTLIEIGKNGEDGCMVTPSKEKPRAITVTYDGKEITFDESYYETFRIFLEDLEVYKEEINKSRDEAERPQEIVIYIENGAAYNFDEDLETIWCNNGVKPSFSYEIVKPKLVIQFLEAQISAYENSETAHQEDTGNQDNNNSIDTGFTGDIYIGNNVSYLDKQPQIISTENISEEDLCGENGPFLDYADERYVVFHTKEWFYVYDMMRKDLIWGIGLGDIVDVRVSVSQLKAYIYNMPGDAIDVYECDIANASNALVEELPTVDVFDDFLVTSECVQNDPTVYRTPECIQMTDGRYLYLESGSGLLWDLKLIREDDKGNRTGYDIFLLNPHGLGTGKVMQLLTDSYYSEGIDLNHDGEIEHILIDIEEIQLDRQATAYLKVIDLNGNLLWKKELFLASAGWDSYFRVQTHEGDCLMQYLPIVHQDMATYSYRVFYLDENGNEIEVDSESVEFKPYVLNVSVSAKEAIPYDEMLSFANHANEYLSTGRLMVSTVDGALRYQTPSKTYTYEETYQSVLEMLDIEASNSIGVNITKMQNYYEKMRENFSSTIETE